MRTSNPYRLPRRRGFTLVEVLVVVGVIAMLLAILMPTIRGLRDQARTTACVANLRAIGQAFATYRAGNDNYMPPVYTGPDRTIAPLEDRSVFAVTPFPPGHTADGQGVFEPVGYKVWADILIESTGIPRDRFVCPSARGPGRVSSSVASTGSLESFLGYGINAYIADDFPGKLLGAGANGSGNSQYRFSSPWPFALITRPAEGLLVADSFVGGVSATGGQAVVAAVQVGLENRRFAVGDPRRLSNVFRHVNERSTNVLFFDGHVELRQPSTGGTLVAGAPNDRARNAVLDQPPFALGTSLFHETPALSRQPSALWRPWKPYFK
jgi:prepilin-type N-terminal cleavage/methylation domain-containing protein/prepilin-type processing-associated H-X9-DG protein